MGVANRLGLKIIDETEKNEKNDVEKQNKELEIVKNFYYRPDIVYTCPGMRDSIAVRKDGKKITLPRHYLTLFLREAFAIFKQDSPNIKLGFSKFCSLRPDNVLLLKDTPSKQCKCKIHENFSMKLKGLKITYSQKLWDDILCNVSLNSCYCKNMCDVCCNLKNMNKPNIMSQVAIWKEWVKADDKKYKLIIHETSTGELFEKIKEDFIEFLHHVSIRRIQSDAFLNDKNNPSVRILQIDFAMSYSCEYRTKSRVRYGQDQV
ncbi:hypothetical protein ILUMI_06732 [Ignelater luminosus]|uniref:Uncharacterized protein n=1 Tax=Ignelater luminosus TaxID=2038154 RepID=A0A8K0GGY3_IGNLU|nr:hypothetical protein ILUMI_06732 [Ignelater luminosus]